MPGLNISRKEALERSTHLAIDSYIVTLDVTAGERTFLSKSTVKFSCHTPGFETFIDAVGTRVISATLNGAAIDTSNFDGESIFLKNLALANELTIEMEAEYSKNGEGLQRSVDPVDNEAYLYSQGETAHIRNMYPCFDQPDLKATFTLTAIVPSHWEVISNNPIAKKSDLADSKVQWEFTTTPRIPTYICVLVAGPYAHVHDEFVGKKTIPLGIFCRKSLFEFLDPEDIFLVTKQGFKYFEDKMDLIYPFDKYDQIAVLDFNFGAMENAGAVTFREDGLVFRSKVTDRGYLSRANMILHEMAHMWFGDMVTMKWWDDLWLNESFAEWASYSALAGGTRFTNGWSSFTGARKNWAYSQDQLSTTHPIIADMFDIEAVNANFDGITYAKGASVLQQLVQYVGEDNFILGLQRYFKKHAWGNTTLQDLLVELEAASGRILGQWVATWLQTAGVNTLRPRISLAAEKYTSVEIIQETPAIPADSTELRIHRLAVALYDIVNDEVVLRKSVKLDVEGAVTRVPELEGESVADLFLINDGDLSYAKIRFDEKSITTLKSHLGRFKDPLARALCWSAAWDMTRDSEISATDFIEIALSGLAGEDDIFVVTQVLMQIASTTAQYAHPSHRDELALKVSEKLAALMQLAAPGSDHQLQFARSFAFMAQADEHTARIRSILAGELPGLTIDTELRWALITALAERGALTHEELEAEYATDKTVNGGERYFTALAAFPTANAKAQAWKSITEDEQGRDLRMAKVAGFLRPRHRDLLAAYIDPYFEILIEVWNTKTYEQSSTFVTSMYPVYNIDQVTLDKTNSWLSGVGKEASAILIKLMNENKDELERSLKAQNKDQ